MRREPSLGGTGGLEEDEEYRRCCTWLVALSRPVEGTFWAERGMPDRGAHAARRNDVDNMVDVRPSNWEELEMSLNRRRNRRAGTRRH